ncbi:MAG: TetR/AcrR family transcriptional regulator [Marmoricola sp.]
MNSTPADDPAPWSDGRARLYQAAIEAFATRGFHATTTRDIAAAAGMSPAALYAHHRTKEELLYVIAVLGHQESLGLVRRAIASHEHPVDQLRALAHSFAEFHAVSHTTARVLNYELAALEPDHRAEVDDLRHHIDHETRALVVRGVSMGAFTTPNPTMAATAILSLGVDLARWFSEGHHWTPRQIADFYADAALRIVGADQAAPPRPDQIKK